MEEQLLVKALDVKTKNVIEKVEVISEDYYDLKHYIVDLEIQLEKIKNDLPEKKDEYVQVTLDE